MAGMADVRRARFGVRGDDAKLCRTLMREYAAHLNASIGGEHICVTTLERELAALPGAYAEPAGVVLLAFVDGEPAGCVALRPVPTNTTAAGEAEMKRLWVRPAYQGFGLGRTLAQAVVDLARQRGYSAIILDTMPRTMPSAFALYRSMGFAVMRGSLDTAAHRSIDVAEMVYMRRELQGPDLA